MDRPHFSGRIKLAPAKATLRTLHELACRHAERQYREQGESDFLWAIAIDTEVWWLTTNWTDEEEKQMSVAFMRDLMRLLSAHAYSSVTEAWMAVLDENTDELDRMLMEDVRAQGGAVYDLPARLRQDVLLVSTHTKTGHRLSRYAVTVKPSGNQLGKREDIPYPTIEGRMTTLLGDDPEADRRLVEKLTDPELAALMQSMTEEMRRSGK